MGQLVEFESKLKGVSETESSCSSLDSTGSHDSLNTVTPMILAD